MQSIPYIPRQGKTLDMILRLESFLRRNDPPSGIAPGGGSFFVLKQFVGFYAQGVCDRKNGVQGYGAISVFYPAEMVAADLRKLIQF